MSRDSARQVWNVDESIVVRLVPQGREQQYYEEIEQLIERNREDYVPWHEYAAEDGAPKKAFFANYRSTDERLLTAQHSNDGVCGFATIDTPSDRDDIPTQPPFTYYSLMMVDSHYRRQGVATTFYDAVLNDILPMLGGPNPVVLGTWESNTAQQDLLERFGFEHFATKPDHRTNDEATEYYRTTYPQRR